MTQECSWRLLIWQIKISSVWLDPALKNPMMIARTNFGTNDPQLLNFTSPGSLQEPAGRWPGSCTTSDPTSAAGTWQQIQYRQCDTLPMSIPDIAFLSKPCLMSYLLCSTFNNLLPPASWAPRSPSRLHTLTSSLELAGRRPRSLSKMVSLSSQ